MPPKAIQVLPPQARAALAPLRKDQYAYVIDFVPINGGTSKEGSFTVENEADFDLEQLTYFAAIATNDPQTESGRVIPVVTAALSTTDTRKLNSKPVPIAALFGTGSIPFVLKYPKRLVANSQFIANVSNLTVATHYNLWLVFIGSKIFR
jgi:hypothetical protein